jgi:hypothetical protein
MLWKPTFEEASMVCQNPSMVIPKEPGAIPARNFCRLVDTAAATDDRLLAVTMLAATAPADFRNDLRSSLISIVALYCETSDCRNKRVYWAKMYYKASCMSRPLIAFDRCGFAFPGPATHSVIH